MTRKNPSRWVLYRNCSGLACCLGGVGIYTAEEGEERRDSVDYLHIRGRCDDTSDQETLCHTFARRHVDGNPSETDR